MENNTQEKPAYTFDAFVPVILIAASLMILLVWNVAVLVRDLNNTMLVRTQQNMARAQALGAEEQMKALMMELLGMAQADPDAKAITDKYQIRYNAPAQQSGAAQTPAPKPTATPRKPAASGEKPAASGEKPAASGEKSAASGEKSAASGEKPAAAPEKSQPPAPKPAEGN
jgi:non-homologous end joining protein Ku